MNRRRILRAIGLPVLLCAAAAYLQARPQQPAEVSAPAPLRQSGAATDSAVTADRAVLAKYCVSCHSEKAKQGNPVLTTLDVANPGTDAERWEPSSEAARASVPRQPAAPERPL